MNSHLIDSRPLTLRALGTLGLQRGMVGCLGGFSLVEVVIALAIAAVGIVSILGLLPHSLETIKKTGNLTSEARIVQKIAGESNLGGWDDGGGATSVYQYFDDQGLEVEKNDPDFRTRFAYVAELDVPVLDARLPSTGGTGSVEQNLRRVIVKIAPVPVENFNFNTAEANSFRTYTLLVARMKLRSE